MFIEVDDCAVGVFESTVDQIDLVSLYKMSVNEYGRKIAEAAEVRPHMNILAEIRILFVVGWEQGHAKVLPNFATVIS